MLEGMKRRLRRTSEVYAIPYLILWISFLWNYLVYGCSCTEYCMYEFFQKKHRFKSRFMTHRKCLKVYKIFGHKDYIKYLNDKKLFNEKFSKFIKRDWIFSKEATDESIRTFLNKHKNIMVKPLSMSSGKGILHFDYSQDNSEEFISTLGTAGGGCS